MAALAAPSLVQLARDPAGVGPSSKLRSQVGCAQCRQERPAGKFSLQCIRKTQSCSKPDANTVVLSQVSKSREATGCELVEAEKVVNRRDVLTGVTLAAGALAFLAPAAEAVVQIQLSNLKYEPCKQPDTVGPGSSLYKAKCFSIKGETTNLSGQTVYNADVFGFVYDAYDEPAIPNRGRLASIAEIPPGKGTFEIQIVIPASEVLPLKLKSFRATGFLGSVNRSGNPYED